MEQLDLREKSVPPYTGGTLLALMEYQSKFQIP
jgi:hypothetical protein